MGVENDEVLVSFPMGEDIWNTVVVNGTEEMTVEEEGSDAFVVAYASREEFHSAVNRFGGSIEYREVS